MTAPKSRALAPPVLWSTSPASPPPDTWSASYGPLRVGHYWLDESTTPPTFYQCVNNLYTGPVWLRLTDLAIGGTNTNVIFAGAGNGTLTGNDLFLAGIAAASAATTMSYSVVIGGNAARLHEDGDGVVAVGQSAAELNEHGQLWVALGQEAGAVALGSSFTAVGAGAAGYATSGEHYTAIGYLAGEGLTSGSSGTFVGAQTSQTDGTWSNCIAIGREATCTAEGQVALGSAGYAVLTHATAGSVTSYLELNVNGTVYRVPLHAVS